VLGSRLAALLRRGYVLTLAWVVIPVDFDFVPLLGWVVECLAPEGVVGVSAAIVWWVFLA
jgi:hypothetical protein